MQITATAAIKVNECSVNATCHEPLWGIRYSAYFEFGLMMICCTFSVHSGAARNTLLRRYKYLIMSALHVKDKCLKFKPSAFFLCCILTTTLLPEWLECYYSRGDCQLIYTPLCFRVRVILCCGNAVLTPLSG